MSLRIGHGLDAHRFASGGPLRLGGVDVEYDEHLDGHSDGDVALHALGNAILGAAGLGDMGSRFPSTDSRWRAVLSTAFLGHIVDLMNDRGCELLTAQVVVIAERPRLAAYLESMAIAIAGALDVQPGRVAISVTSTDGLGFAGRGEGIASSAVALVGSRVIADRH